MSVSSVTNTPIQSMQMEEYSTSMPAQELHASLELLNRVLIEYKEKYPTADISGIYETVLSRVNQLPDLDKQKAEIGAAIFVVANERLRLLGDAYEDFVNEPETFCFAGYAEEVFVFCGTQFASEYQMIIPKHLESAFTPLKNSFLTNYLVDCLILEMKDTSIVINDAGICFLKQLLAGRGGKNDLFRADHLDQIRLLLNALEKNERLRKLLCQEHKIHPEMLPFVWIDLSVPITHPYMSSFASKAVLVCLLSPKKQGDDEYTCFLIGQFNYLDVHETVEIATLAFHILEHANFNVGNTTLSVVPFLRGIPKKYLIDEEELDYKIFKDLSIARSLFQFLGIEEDYIGYFEELAADHAEISFNGFIEAVKNNDSLKEVTGTGMEWVDAYQFGCRHNLLYQVLFKALMVQHHNHNLDPIPKEIASSLKREFWKMLSWGLYLHVYAIVREIDESDDQMKIEDINLDDLYEFLRSTFSFECKKYLFFDLMHRPYIEYTEDGSLELKATGDNILKFEESSFNSDELDLLQEFFKEEIYLLWIDNDNYRPVRTKQDFKKELLNILSKFESQQAQICSILRNVINSEKFDDLICDIIKKFIDKKRNYANQQMQGCSKELLKKIDYFALYAPGGYGEFIYHLVTRKHGSQDFWSSVSVEAFFKKLIIELQSGSFDLTKPVLVSNANHDFILMPRCLSYLLNESDQEKRIADIIDQGSKKKRETLSVQEIRDIIDRCIPKRMHNKFHYLVQDNVYSLMNICVQAQLVLSENEKDAFDHAINEYMRTFNFNDSEQKAISAFNDLWINFYKLPLDPKYTEAIQLLETHLAKKNCGKAVDLALIFHEIYCEIQGKEISIYFLEHSIAQRLNISETLIFGDLNSFSGSPDDPIPTKIGVGFNFSTDTLGFFQRQKSEDIPLSREDTQEYLSAFALFVPGTSSAHAQLTGCIHQIRPRSCLLPDYMKV